MFPWGSIISLAGQAASGVMSAINNKRMQDTRDAEYAREGAHYAGVAAENPLSRSEVRYMNGQYDKDAKKQLETAQNVAAITGATPEYSLGVQKGIAEGKANLMAREAADASGRADWAKEKGEQAAQNHYKEKQAYNESRNSTYANIAANAASAFGGIVDSYGTKAQAAKKPAATTTQQPAATTIQQAPTRAGKLQAAADDRKHVGNTLEANVLQNTANAAKAAAAAPPTAETEEERKKRLGLTAPYAAVNSTLSLFQ